MPKKTQTIKYKRAPGAPKRFKSGFLFFSEHQHKMIRDQTDKKLRAADVAKVVSQAWKELPDSERAVFLEMGRADRQRYEREKASYKGPWKVPNVKDPEAPKKPMSAFLAFGNERRRALAEANPHLTGNELSCLLSKLWKESPAEVKKAYKEKQAREREVFKQKMAEFERQKDQALAESLSTSSSTSDSCTDDSSSHSDDSESTHELFNNFSNYDYEGNMNNPMAPVMTFSDIEKPSFWDESADQSNNNALFMPSSGLSFPSLQFSETTTTSTTTTNTTTISGENGHNEYLPNEAWPFHRVLLPNDYNNNTKTVTVPPPTVSEKVSRYENYTMEDLLEDEELFVEDFSPSHVARITPPTMQLPPVASPPLDFNAASLELTKMFAWKS